MKNHVIDIDEIRNFTVNQKFLIAASGRHKRLEGTLSGLFYVKHEQGEFVTGNLAKAVGKYNEIIEHD